MQNRASRVSISVVVPMHNEALIVEELVRRTLKTCRIFARVQLILVDDGSSDQTWRKITEAAQSNSSITGIRLARNFGHQKAVLAGLDAVIYENVAIIDGDLQDPPELIPDMIEKMHANGVDIVYGQRITRKGESFFKRKSAELFYRMFSKIISFPIPLDVGDFRVFKKAVIPYLLESRDPSPFLRGLFAHTGLSAMPYMYKREARFAGESKYGLRKMFAFALNAVFGFSDLPFRLFLRLALGTMFVALIVSGYAIYHAVVTGSLPGWVSLFLLNLYMGSLNFLFLSLLGKYITLNFEISLKRPRWIVGEKIN